MAWMETNCKQADLDTYGIVGSVYSSQENDLRKSNGYNKILVNWGTFWSQCPEKNIIFLF